MEIVYEDRDVLVVNKPPGLLTSTGPREKRPTLLKQVREYLPRDRVGLIHRLDRDARGLLVFSKNDQVYRSLKTQFFHHTVDRQYLAAAIAPPKTTSGEITFPLIERADGVVRVAGSRDRGEEAHTHYEVIPAAEAGAGASSSRTGPGMARLSNEKFTLLRVTLQTGRKHQIRVHLATIGCPIKGDPIYTPPPHNKPPLLLAAVLLAFDHPRSGKRMKFELPIPKEFINH